LQYNYISEGINFLDEPILEHDMFRNGGVKFSMKTMQHAGHTRAKRAFNGVAIKKSQEDYK